MRTPWQPIAAFRVPFAAPGAVRYAEPLPLSDLSRSPALIDHFQRCLRHHGVDVMSYTGGVLSAAHTESDIDEATTAFERTVISLRDECLIQLFD